MRQAALLVLTTLAIGAASGHQLAAQVRPASPLTTTSHAPLPSHPSHYWLVPETSLARTSAGAQGRDSAASRFARGAALIAQGDHAAGLPLVTNADLSGTPLAQYGRYYAGVALFNLRRLGEADAVLTAVVDAEPEGYLSEAAPLRLADTVLARSEPKRAVDLLDDLADEKLMSPEEVTLRLGLAREAAGNRARALRGNS
jgi:hypothetical protein